MGNLGKTLLIVNPTSQTGKGESAGDVAAALLRVSDQVSELEVVRTEYPRHAEVVAAERGASFDTLIALGGDGTVHESANGLMKLPQEQRPRFGVIPVGSGNDYATTLGMSLNVEEAVAQLLAVNERAVDVGCCNGRYFVETLSFGVDAAIAIDTVERRKHSNKTGKALYFESGVNQLLFHRDAQLSQTRFDDEEPRVLETMTFCIQVGRTYGGGFIICPKADPSDGLFDICIAHAPFGLVKALVLFSKAKEGGHVGHKQVELRRASSVSVTFGHVVPAQMDGEDCSGTIFEVSIVPLALRSLFAS